MVNSHVGEHRPQIPRACLDIAGGIEQIVHHLAAGTRAVQGCSTAERPHPHLCPELLVALLQTDEGFAEGFKEAHDARLFSHGPLALGGRK